VRAVGILLVVSLSGILLSCTSRLESDDERAAAPEAKAVRYSLVYVIHGDGEYTYHDSAGIPHRADEEALSGALLVGERSADAEVFIFYQQPPKRVLFFGGDDGKFWCFRRGQTIISDSYSRDDPDLKQEIQLYRKYSVGGDKTFLLYYGHEIPAAGGENYDESETGREFNVASWSRALETLANGIRSASHVLDLLVLSTCYNGSPCTISRLAPYARHIIASPEYLHLSYMRSRLFESLDSLNNVSTAEIARQFARESFERLKNQTETAITVVVYDTRQVQPFLNSSTTECDSLVKLLDTGDRMATLHYFDWLDDSALFHNGADRGVTVFYRPPEFGRLAKKKSHSGWEAWGVKSSEELRVKSEELKSRE
jgi:hypothetical protein